MSDMPDKIFAVFDENLKGENFGDWSDCKDGIYIGTLSSTEYTRRALVDELIAELKVYFDARPDNSLQMIPLSEAIAAIQGDN